MKTFIRKKVVLRSFGQQSPISDPATNRQRKPEETHRNPANLKQAADSKTDTNQNGVQINKHLSRIWV